MRGLRCQSRPAGRGWHLENLKVKRLGFGPKVGGKYHMVAGGVGKGYRNEGEFKAPDIAEAIRKGL
jgi:hypothetical protein